MPFEIKTRKRKGKKAELSSQRSWFAVQAQSQPPLTSQRILNLKWFLRIYSDEPRWPDIYHHINPFLDVGLPRKGCNLDWGPPQLKRLAAKVHLPTMLPESETISSSLKEECLGNSSQCLLHPMCLVVLCFIYKSHSFLSARGFIKIWSNGQIWPVVFCNKNILKQNHLHLFLPMATFMS